jgi:hypothetical protein
MLAKTRTRRIRENRSHQTTFWHSDPISCTYLLIMLPTVSFRTTTEIYRTYYLKRHPKWNSMCKLTGDNSIFQHPVAPSLVKLIVWLRYEYHQTTTAPSTGDILYLRNFVFAYFIIYIFYIKSSFKCKYQCSVKDFRPNTWRWLSVAETCSWVKRVKCNKGCIVMGSVQYQFYLQVTSV